MTWVIPSEHIPIIDEINSRFRQEVRRNHRAGPLSAEQTNANLTVSIHSHRACRRA
jgi:hypothetical protein